MKEWLYRALRTFFQAALGFIAANLVVTISGINMADRSALTGALTGVIASAVAAGIAAVMNRNKGEGENDKS